MFYVITVFIVLSLCLYVYYTTKYNGPNSYVEAIDLNKYYGKVIFESGLFERVCLSDSFEVYGISGTDFRCIGGDYTFYLLVEKRGKIERILIKDFEKLRSNLLKDRVRYLSIVEQLKQFDLNVS